MARRNVPPHQQNSSAKDAHPQRSTDKGIVSLKLTYNPYKLLPNTTENAPVVRSVRSNKGKGGRAEQLISVFHAIRPGEFKSNDLDKAKKTSSSNVPASAPVNPMAPTEKRRRAPTKVSTVYLSRAAVVTNLFVQKNNSNAPAAEQGVPRFLVPPGSEPALVPAHMPVLKSAATGVRFGLRLDRSNPPQPRPQIAYAAPVINTRSAIGRNSSSGQAGRQKQPLQIDPSLLPSASQVQKPVGASPNSRTASHVLGPITQEDAEDEQAADASRDEDSSGDDNEESKASDGDGDDDDDDGRGSNSDEDANNGLHLLPNVNYNHDEFDGNHDDYDTAVGHHPMGVDIGIMLIVLCACVYK
jgi:hypothetical protein